MSETVEVVRFSRGQRIDVTRRPVDLGVARHAKTRSSIMLNAPPASLDQKRRIMARWQSSKPIVGAFGGDGEAIDFAAGTERDWRSSNVTLTGNEEQDEGALEDEAKEWYRSLNKRAATAALVKAYDLMLNANNGAGNALKTGGLVVLAVFAILSIATYLQNNDGLSGIMPSLGGVTP